MGPVSLDDRTLIGRAREGDVEAFGELVRRHERRVVSVLSRLLDDRRDVEEAAQDVFVQAWRNLSHFREDAALFTWLYRIAVNEALQRRRRRHVPVARLERDLPASAPGMEGDLELRELLLVQLERLPFELRAPLVLRDVEGLSNEEVAATLDLSVPAAKSRIHRARMRLREALEEWEQGQ